MVDPNLVDTYVVGQEGFIVGLCESLGLPETFNQALESINGRPTDIPYGVDAMIMMVNMCQDHRPLSRIHEFYKYCDLEGLFHYPVQLEQLNDDRLGGFLDLYYKAGCRKIFTQIAAKAVTLYGIKINNINFDTTSKVMWGQYETDEGTLGAIKMEFGHSKDKRDDKKQIKFGVGCANGLIVDACVLSGNMDDKTYNKETLQELESTLENLNVNKDSFYYIADSALFSEDNLTIAAEKEIQLITRMPDNVLIAKNALEEAVNQLDTMKPITIENSKKDGSTFRITEKTCVYAGHDLSLVVCYSESLRPTKVKTIGKAVVKEANKITGIIKPLSKREFACKEDANVEIAKLKDKTLKKVNFHDVTYSVRMEAKRRRGRPSKTKVESPPQEYKYFVDITYVASEQKIISAIEQASCFVLCSNDTSLSGESMLREYKTQDSVEKKFQQLKSPQFVNSIFLESPKRIEAFSYLMMLCMLILSLTEYVVRKGLQEDDDLILGPNNKKMKRPTQRAIYDIFYAVRIRLVRYHDKPWERTFAHPLSDSIKKVLKYLHIPENTFIMGRRQ